MSYVSIYKQKSKQLIDLALPIIAGQLGQVLMGFFDTVQIGGLGHEYIAASGFANGIYWMTILLGMGVLFAVSPLVSKSIGENKTYRGIGILKASVWVSIGLSMLFMLVTYIMAENLAIFKHSQSDNELGSKFLHVINYSTIFVFLFTAGKQFLDGMGKTKPGMQITLAGLLFNCGLNYLLIYGRCGFPKLGIEGAALANTISRALMCIVLFWIILKDKSTRNLNREFKSSGEKSINFVLPIIVIGIPAGLQFFWEVAAFNAGQVMSGWISTTAEAAHMIAIGLASITFMVATGISSASTILIGYAYGAKDMNDVRISGYTALGITLAVEIVFAVFFILGHTILPCMYTNEIAVINLASLMLIFAGFFQMSDGLQAVATGALRGVQDVKMPAVIAFISYWIIMAPLSYTLAFKLNFGLKGIWIGFIVGLTVAATLLIMRFRYLTKNDITYNG